MRTCLQWSGTAGQLEGQNAKCSSYIKRCCCSLLATVVEADQCLKLTQPKLSEELLPAQLVVPHRDERSADRVNACIDQCNTIPQVTATALWPAEGNCTSIRR